MLGDGERREDRGDDRAGCGEPIGDRAGDPVPRLGPGHGDDELECGQHERREAQPEDGVDAARRQSRGHADDRRGECEDGDRRSVAPAGDDCEHAAGQRTGQRGAPCQDLPGGTDAGERALAEALLGEGDEQR